MTKINLFDELIVDNFAGGGGASTGIEFATGCPVDIAINHDEAAIKMHKLNHPFTRHFCENVWDINPHEITRGRRVGIAWFSPDCTHFSKAKGGKPVKKEIRGLAWVAVRWAATVRPRVIFIENVEEFKTWGPIKNGQPVKSQHGKTFCSFIYALRNLGYSVEWKELRACDYGAPTIRKRFFLIARCDGKPIAWPMPTHGDPKSESVRSGKIKPWITAAEIIDWSLPCPSIFDSSEEIFQKYGLRAVRPLADATLRRIARGLQKFVIYNPEPFIAFFNDNSAGQITSLPLNTVIASATRFGIVSPTIIPIGYGERKGQLPRVNEINEPVSTIVSVCKQYLVAPTVIQYHGEQSGNEVRGQNLKNPLLTADAANRYGLVTSHLIIFRNNMYGQEHTEPLKTVMTSQGHFGEVRALLIKHGVCSDGIVKIKGEQYAIADIGLRMLTPRELFNAQGFPPDYIIDTAPDGKTISKAAQVARCGNAVPPPFAEALVRANCPELCSTKIETMADLKMRMVV
jgi:DNA (cytosine-5)-methyltransferase 1